MKKEKVYCWECGNVVEEWDRYILFENEKVKQYVKFIQPHTRVFCKECHDRLEKQQEEEDRLYVRLRKKRMFDKACLLLERQFIPMYEYQGAINVVKDAIEENPDKFDSSYEMIAAIVLVQNRIYSKTQYKVGRYQVDFLLPEIGVVLEIDGERHKYRKGYDSIRDEEIKKTLGAGWDVIRIDTKYLEKSAAKLPEAIDRVIDYRETGKTPWRKIYGNKK